MAKNQGQRDRADEETGLSNGGVVADRVERSVYDDEYGDYAYVDDSPVSYDSSINESFNDPVSEYGQPEPVVSAAVPTQMDPPDAVPYADASDYQEHMGGMQVADLAMELDEDESFYDTGDDDGGWADGVMDAATGLVDVNPMPGGKGGGAGEPVVMESREMGDDYDPPTTYDEPDYGDSGYAGNEMAAATEMADIDPIPRGEGYPADEMASRQMPDDHAPPTYVDDKYDDDAYVDEAYVDDSPASDDSPINENLKDPVSEHGQPQPVVSAAVPTHMDPPDAVSYEDVSNYQEQMGDTRVVDRAMEPDEDESFYDSGDEHDGYADGMMDAATGLADVSPTPRYLDDDTGAREGEPVVMEGREMGDDYDPPTTYDEPDYGDSGYAGSGMAAATDMADMDPPDAVPYADASDYQEHMGETHIESAVDDGASDDTGDNEYDDNRRDDHRDGEDDSSSSYAPTDPGFGGGADGAYVDDAAMQPVADMADSGDGYGSGAMVDEAMDVMAEPVSMAMEADTMAYQASPDPVDMMETVEVVDDYATTADTGYDDGLEADMAPVEMEESVMDLDAPAADLDLVD